MIHGWIRRPPHGPKNMCFTTFEAEDERWLGSLKLAEALSQPIPSNNSHYLLNWICLSFPLVLELSVCRTFVRFVLVWFISFLFLLVSRKGCCLYLWHFLDFSLTFLLYWSDCLSVAEFSYLLSLWTQKCFGKTGSFLCIGGFIHDFFAIICSYLRILWSIEKAVLRYCAIFWVT